MILIKEKASPPKVKKVLGACVTLQAVTPAVDQEQSAGLGKPSLKSRLVLALGLGCLLVFCREADYEGAGGPWVEAAGSILNHKRQRRGCMGGGVLLLF